jgi:hypothetical protein
MLNFDSSRLSHAYIADEHIADKIAQTVVCSKRSEDGPCTLCAHCQKAARKIHPDIIFISKLQEKRDITIDQIRDLKKDVIVVPNEARQKAYIVNDAHLMNVSAQNAFLQILEEPPKHVVFILKTAFPAQLLPTILSRCILIKSDQNIKLTTDSETNEEGYELSEMVSKFYSALTTGNTAIVEFMFMLEKLNKEQFSDFITSARSEAALLLRNPPDIGNANYIKTISEAEKLLVEANRYLDLNVNVGHISGFICANLVKS